MGRAGDGDSQDGQRAADKKDGKYLDDWRRKVRKATGNGEGEDEDELMTEHMGRIGNGETGDCWTAAGKEDVKQLEDWRRR